MNQDDEISLLQSNLKIWTHLTQLQNEVVKLKARVQKLEDSAELRDLLDSEPKAEGAYSFPEFWNPDDE